jgi:uroporphyrinogen-III synthase
VNKTVLVTRPDPAGSELCKKIDDEGYKSIHLPTIEFAFPKDAAHMKKAIALLGEQDWIIFISPQAVMACVPLILDAWPVLPRHIQFAGIGKGTSMALAAAGYKAIFPKDEWTAEALLNMPAFQDVAGKKIAIVRGEGGREILEEGLIARRALTTSIIVYRRVMPDIDMTNCIELLKEKQIGIVASTSYTGVEHLKTMVGDSAWPYLQKVPLIVVSERIRTLAHELGFQSIFLANNASHAAMLETIKGIYNDRK